MGAMPSDNTYRQAANYITAGAGEGNRTLVISLENFCSTIELHPQTGTKMPVTEAFTWLQYI
jgi:hypothetical protein